MRILNTIPKSVRIKKIIVENEMVKTFVLDHSVGAKPGQFVNVWIPRLDEKPISVATDDGKELTLTIAAVGPFSKAMHELKEGDRVGIRGPFGTTFEWKPCQHLALLGGGYGAAPLYFLAKEASKDGCKIEFIVGARRQDLLLYTDRVVQLPGVTLHVATDDGSAGHHGYNTQVLEKILDSEKIDSVITVGPEIMMLKGGQMAEARGVASQISVERYMKCGFGICGNCCVDGLGVPTCIDGPVMSFEKVKKIEDFGKYHRDHLGKKHYY
jgi:dihydroorotate dehydrogenase electron transfer subunit